ncbi:hypothetical protein [Streptomyces roseochromogenus]|uniref:Uncharacterized protein n=1 Tax=Streptomyces roseochromogenus subsp. oscitans DS 12.976 TaxID=1352936 RepID=V6JMJ3_STRRC|nr:hypothetical protein [Streptomyces roseochromogenus]EST18064.1 hypothetical protein M878_45715 [Streptomyces roseochromogenus subsp. oscitans DS 12.976]
MPSALTTTAPYWEESVARERAAAVARTLEEAGHLPHIPGERAGYRLWTDGVADVHLEYRDREGCPRILTPATAHRYSAESCPDCAPGHYEQSRAVQDWVNALNLAGWWASPWEPEWHNHSVGGTVHRSQRRGASVSIPMEPRRATAAEYAVATYEALGGYFVSRYTQAQAQRMLTAAHRRGLLVSGLDGGTLTVPRLGGTRVVLKPLTAETAASLPRTAPTVDAVCAVLRDEEWGDFYGAALVIREGDEVLVVAQWEDTEPGEKGEREMQRHHDTMLRYAAALEKRWAVRRVRRGSVLVPGASFVGALRVG